MPEVNHSDVAGRPLAIGEYIAFCSAGHGATGMRVGKIHRILPKTVEVKYGDKYFFRTPENVVRIEEPARGVH